MLRPRIKIRTCISKLLIGDYFIPIGQETVYRFLGYDDLWCLWIGEDMDGNFLLFDDFRCTWIPSYEIEN